jgi:hypothetical protein
MKGVMWPCIVWIVTEILFRIAALANQAAGAQFEANAYSVATVIGLALGIWAGFSVKEVRGTDKEAIVGGVLVGLACGIPAVILFGLSLVPFAINMTILSLAVTWAGWAIRAIPK